jgi:vacuolar-type H+-ATPase subunit C/Vma6
MKIKEIADYINNYINEKETNNYKTFDYFVYPNFYENLCNFLNATYESSTNHILIKNFVIIIDNGNGNDNKYKVYITDNDLIEPKGPI